MELGPGPVIILEIAAVMDLLPRPLESKVSQAWTAFIMISTFLKARPSGASEIAVFDVVCLGRCSGRYVLFIWAILPPPAAGVYFI